MPYESRLTSEGNSRIEIKKSVFIGHCASVASPAEAADFIAKELLTRDEDYTLLSPKGDLRHIRDVG